MTTHPYLTVSSQQLSLIVVNGPLLHLEIGDEIEPMQGSGPTCMSYIPIHDLLGILLDGLIGPCFVLAAVILESLLCCADRTPRTPCGNNPHFPFMVIIFRLLLIVISCSANSLEKILKDLMGLFHTYKERAPSLRGGGCGRVAEVASTTDSSLHEMYIVLAALAANMKSLFIYSCGSGLVGMDEIIPLIYFLYRIF